MKSFLILLVMFLALDVSAQAKKTNSTVAVLEFQKTGAITGDDVQTLTNRFRAMLFQTRTFNVVERQKMKEILKEQEFMLSDECSTNECAVQVGQLLGVEFMIAGDIGLIGDTYTIDLRMIDVRTGQLVQTRSKDHAGKISGLLEIMKQIAESFSQVQGASAVSNIKPKEEVKTLPSKTATDEGKTKSRFWGEKMQARTVSLRLALGSAIPSGKFNTDGNVNSGSNFMIGCSYFLTTKLQVGIDLGSQTFNNDNSASDFTLKTFPFVVTGRYYTLLRRFKNYVALGFGSTRISGSIVSNNSYFTAKLGTGVSYDISKKIGAELSLDFANVGSKKKLGYNTTYTQFGLGVKYNLTF